MGTEQPARTNANTEGRKERREAVFVSVAVGCDLLGTHGIVFLTSLAFRRALFLTSFRKQHVEER